MKVIIAGSRSITAWGPVLEAIMTAPFKISEVVSGAAIGVDTTAILIAKHWDMPYTEFPVAKEDWDRLGRAAGPLRNEAMADYADALIAIWNGYSTGTKNMIEHMNRLGKPVFIFDYV